MPWLAASGPLAYTPEDPPSRDYYFQYSWILPGILDPATNKRHHFYFGAYAKDQADELFSFWQTAREGGVARVACHFGKADAPEVTAPLAVYSMRDLLGRACFLLMQHGSYQSVPFTRSGAPRNRRWPFFSRRWARLTKDSSHRAYR